MHCIFSRNPCIVKIRTGTACTAKQFSLRLTDLYCTDPLLIINLKLYKKALYGHTGINWGSPKFHLWIKSSEKKIQQEAKANFTGVKFNLQSFHIVLFIIDGFLAVHMLNIAIRVSWLLIGGCFY